MRAPIERIVLNKNGDYVVDGDPTIYNKEGFEIGQMSLQAAKFWFLKRR